MDDQTRAILNAGEEAVERAQGDTQSRQPRFANNATAFGAFLNWVRIAEIEAVPYAANSMARDQWLRNFWKLEPHLAGVMNSVVLIDSNRGWSIVGGRNQVRRYTDILHQAENGAGWRTFMRKAALSYWATDMGSVTEIGRDGEGGPLRSLYHVDSARCRLTGLPQAPLQYQSPQAGPQLWGPGDFFRVCSMPSDDEAFNGLGFCAVSRAVEIVRLLYAVLQHDQEQVGARAPKGLLLLHGISQEQWEDSLKSREAALDSMERRYYSGVQVLANSGIDQIDAKLVALSQLPETFNAKEFLDLSMYALALCFGYDPSEFWPVQFGSIGRGKESEVQRMKATSKGGMEFALAWQEQLQQQLPPTLQFEFEQRDEEGELNEAFLAKAKLDVVATAYQAGIMQGVPLLSREEARSLLVEHGIIPPEWTASQEVVESTDTESAETDSPATANAADTAERWLESDRVQRAMSRFPDEPIVRYQWPAGKMTTLWQPKRRSRLFPVVKRADDEGVLYNKNGVTITEADVDKAIAQAKRRVSPEFAQLLDAPTLTPDEIAKLNGEQ